MNDPRHPFLEFWLNGRALGLLAMRHLLSVEVRESQTDLDTVTASFAIPEGPLKFLDMAYPGSTFEVRMGYNGIPLRTVFGDIVEINHQRSSSAPWVMNLTGLDCLHRLKDKQGAAAQEGTHSEIVRAIAAECGFIPEVEEVGTTGGTSIRLEEDYATYLARLARTNNYFVRIEKARPTDPKPTLRFGRRSMPALNLPIVAVWGLNVESVDLRLSLEKIVSQVEVRGRDYTQDMRLDGRATPAVLRRISGGETGAEMVTRAFGERSFTVDNSPDPQMTDAQTHAESEMRDRAERFLTGSVGCVGMPEARSGSKVHIVGAGWPLSGEFMIEETTHSFDPGSGYKTTIQFYSDSLPPLIGF